MAGLRDDHAVSRHVLDNGLRVVLDPSRAYGRVAISVHHAVGFRHEHPGQEGFAHLVEHLLFEGGREVSEGEYRQPINDAGGLAWGTTHQDYTDLYQVLPEELLDTVLRREADRLGYPRFSEGGLAQQLPQVVQEIERARHGTPHAGLSWPLLPAVSFTSFTRRHDGYGDPRRLSSVTPAQLRSFYHQNYSPSRAVLSICGSFDPAEGLSFVQQHLGVLDRAGPHRAQSPQPATEPELAADHWVEHLRSGLGAPASAVSFRVPDPGSALRSYLAHQVLAHLLTDLARSSASAQVTARAGIFGPLETASPDLLVVTATAVDPEHPRAWATQLRQRLGSVTEKDLAGWGQAVRTVRAAYEREHHDLLPRCRALGRYEVLWNSRVTPERIISALDGLKVVDGVRSARELAAQYVGGVLLLPGGGSPEGRQQPAHHRLDPPAPHQTSVAPLRLQHQRPPRPPRRCEIQDQAGARIIALHDPRLSRPLIKLVPHRGVVAAGPDSPEDLLDRLSHQLHIASHDYAEASSTELPTDPSTTSPRLGISPLEGATHTVLLLSRQVRSASSGHTARYLATASFGAYHGSRLAQDHPWYPPGREISVVASRQGSPTNERAELKARCRYALASTVIASIREQVQELSRTPLSTLEMRRARDYCRWQSRAYLDSPHDLVAAVAAAVAEGPTAPLPWELPTALDKVTDEEVQHAASELFAPNGWTGTLSGAIPPGATRLLQPLLHPSSRTRKA